MYVETKGNEGKKEHELGTLLMEMLEAIDIKMSRSEAFVLICEDICGSDRLIWDYYTVADLWKALHMDKKIAYKYLKEASNDYYKDKVLKIWSAYMGKA